MNLTDFQVAMLAAAIYAIRPNSLGDYDESLSSVLRATGVERPAPVQTSDSAAR